MNPTRTTAHTPSSPAAVFEASRSPWLLHSRRRALLFALGAGTAVFCGAFFLERYFHDQGAPTLPMMAASNGIAALFVILLIVRVCYSAIERREAIVERLHAIGEINHHIRNGLEVIQLSAHLADDDGSLSAIRNGVDRIEWTLREILGPCGPLADTRGWRKEQETGHGHTDQAHAGRA